LYTKRSLGSLPRPIPAHECRVHPPMLMDAIPVEAVMPTSPHSASWDLHHLIISRSRTDFPVPADPVKNTFFPRLTKSRTCCCSSDK
ncbi:hypothetical protein K474DRAFT_1590717, partial [Panus rudis PR-1116 ss-1]